MTCFHEDGTKCKEVSPRPSLCHSQSKDFDGHESSVERHLQPQKKKKKERKKEKRKGKKSKGHPLSEGPKHCSLGGSPNILGRAPPRRSKLDHYAFIKFPLTMKSARKKIEDSSTLLLIVNAKANKHQIKQALRKFSDMDRLQSTLWSGLMERRRHMFNWLLTMMP